MLRAFGFAAGLYVNFDACYLAYLICRLDDDVTWRQTRCGPDSRLGQARGHRIGLAGGYASGHRGVADDRRPVGHEKKDRARPEVISCRDALNQIAHLSGVRPSSRGVAADPVRPTKLRQVEVAKVAGEEGAWEGLKGHRRIEMGGYVGEGLGTQTTARCMQGRAGEWELDSVGCHIPTGAIALVRIGEEASSSPRTFIHSRLDSGDCITVRIQRVIRVTEFEAGE